MSNPGQWITFAELCARVPHKSARTLRRYVKDRLISSRQLGGRGGHLEFNWKTVERELAVLTTEGVHADAAAAVAAPEATPADLAAQLADIHQLLAQIAARVGVDNPPLPFGAEQRKSA